MGRAAQRKPESIKSLNNFGAANPMPARRFAQEFPADFRVDRQNVCGCH
jgi:hypothetical protein